MVNILYILFQVSCIILLILLSKNPTVMMNSTPVNQSDYSPNIHTMNIIKQFKINKHKNPLSLDVMEELKNKILTRKSSEFKELEEKIKFNIWNNKNNFDNIVKKKKGIILDLNSVNFNDSFNEFIKNIKFIEKICFEKSIILFIIGEKKNL